MRSTSLRPIRSVQPRRSQAERRHRLRELKPVRLRPWRFNWVVEAAKLVLSVALVIAAVLIWVVF